MPFKCKSTYQQRYKLNLKLNTLVVRVVSRIREFCQPSQNNNYVSLNPRVMIIPDELSAPDGNSGSWNCDTNRLLKAVDEESVEALAALLKKGVSVNAHGGAFHETPLHKAAKQAWTIGLQLLLSHGATPHSMNQFGQTPLHYAAASKSVDCVRSLLEAGCQATIDHRDMRGHTPLHDAAVVGHPEGVALLLKAGASVDVTDKKEETPLHKGARAKCVSVMLALLNRGADMGARDKAGESVLSYVLRLMPAGFDALLDHCLVPNAAKLNSKKLEVAYNFVPLAGRTEMTQMKILSDVVDLGYPKLLLHPVCEAFLLVKWHNVRRLFFIEVILYFIHAILATFLILDKFVWQGVRGTIPENIPPKVYYVLEIILLLHVSFILLKQVLTIIQGFRTWLFSLWHVLNGVIPVLVIMILPGTRNLWQHHIATVTLLLIWVQCMLHIGRFPGCGIYVAMFTRVAKVFVRIFLIFFCLLLAFSMSFYVGKYGGQYSFGESKSLEFASTNTTRPVMEVEDKVYSNPVMTFIKTLTMMIGELDFDSNFVNQLNDLPGTSHTIYFAFVILVSIILSNLLVALAVNDVQGLRNSAHLERLIKQMELVFQMERTFSTLLSLAHIINFSWLHEKINLFVHDFSNTKIYVQPFHPQKASKLVLVERGIIKEISLRQNHVSNMMECLRLREEETTSTRKLSVRKSHQVRPEYSSFSGTEDDIRDLLKVIERNLLEALGEKIENATSSIASLSAKIKALEKLSLNGCAADGDGAPQPPSEEAVPSFRPVANVIIPEPPIRKNVPSIRHHARDSSVRIKHQDRPRSTPQQSLTPNSKPENPSEEQVFDFAREEELISHQKQELENEVRVQLEMVPREKSSYPSVSVPPSDVTIDTSENIT